MAPEAQRGDHRGQGLVPRIDPVAAQEEMDVRQTALESGGGAEEVRVVLERVVPRDEPDERGVRGEAELPATSRRAAGSGRKTSVSRPLGMTVSRSAAKPRRAHVSRTDSEQQTIRVGSHLDSRAHAETVIRVVPLVSRGMWLA